jgi:hypothetical protein
MVNLELKRDNSPAMLELMATLKTIDLEIKNQEERIALLRIGRKAMTRTMKNISSGNMF